MRQVWIYKARYPLGKSVTGEIEADSRENVLQIVSEQGLIPVSVRKRQERITLSMLLGSFGSANREKLIIFTKKLKTLHRAGIPLLRTLSIIERGADELGLKEQLKGIKRDLEAGVSLSKALSRYPKRFPSIYVNSIAAGEASGTLDEVLDQLAALVEKELMLTRQLKSALRYPSMVIVAISIAIFILMSFVIPRFADIYGKFGAALPWPTRIVIEISNFLASYWYVVIVLIIAALFGLKKYIGTEKGRLRWDAMTMKIPLMGDLIIKANIARFAAMLKILFRSGVPMNSCLKILQETTSNKVIAGEIARMADSFEKGREIGDISEQYRFFPAMALEMMEVGLESGSLETIMDELGNHYEMELDYKSRHLTAMLEPILTVAIGGMILILALAIFLPMWNLIQVFR